MKITLIRTGTLACAAFSILLFSAGSAAADDKVHDDAHKGTDVHKDVIVHHDVVWVHRVGMGGEWVWVPAHYERGVLIPGHWVRKHVMPPPPPTGSSSTSM